MSSLKRLTKLKGQSYARALRDAGCGILEIPQIQEIVRHAGDDPEAVIPYLRDLAMRLNIEPQEVPTSNLPWRELLEEAGYTVTVVTHPEEQEPFARYYRQNELLCSFRGAAWDWPLIFFAVHKDAEKVVPAENPQREDEYSTSVLRVKVAHKAVAISSRYNHSVQNPDAVHRCDLDKIAPGLAAAIAEQEGLKEAEGQLLPPWYEAAADGRILKCNHESGGALIGARAWIYRGRMDTVAHNEAIVEGCILSSGDCQMREVVPGSDESLLLDAWQTQIRELISEGWVVKCPDMRRVVATKGEEMIELLTFDGGRLTSINLPTMSGAHSRFLSGCARLHRISLPSVKSAGHHFASWCIALKEINLPSLRWAGNNFALDCSNLKEINLPSLEEAGTNFVFRCLRLEQISLPSLKKVDDNGISDCEALERINLPWLTEVGPYFAFGCSSLKEISLPSLEEADVRFAGACQALEKISAWRLRMAKPRFAFGCKNLREVNLPSLKVVGEQFLASCALEHLNLPSLEIAGSDFVPNCGSLRTLNLPALEKAGRRFGWGWESVQEINLPSLKIAGSDFLRECSALKVVHAPQCEYLPFHLRG
jgi:hypothetical protein